MIFTQSQIQDLLATLQRSHLMFIAQQVGNNFLSTADKAILLASGIDVDKYKNKKGVIEYAFLFGLLAEAIGDKRAKQMNYTQFKKFVASGNFVPLTEEEEFALEQIKNRAYTDITNLGARMRTGVSNAVIRNNQQQAAYVAQKIRKRAINAIENRESVRSLAAGLAEMTKDWEVDWLRIASYLSHEAYNTGRAQSILKREGGDAEVYFDVYEGACEHCRELYLEDPDDEESKPKIFKLREIIENGNNIGRKVAEWKPTVAPTHSFCRCTLVHKQKNMDWDETTHAFTKIRKITSKKVQSKIGDVSKYIKITR